MNSAVGPSLSPVAQDLDQLCVNAIRTLSIDAVQAANSGHPGTPMAMAPVAYYATASGLARGAYVLADPPNGNPEVILIATGSEVSLCVEAYEQLTQDGVRARVVSMPSWELFDEQDKCYRESVFPPSVGARVSVEEASDFGWSKYTGTHGHNLCIETFGASAPLKQLVKKFGFTVERVVAAAKSQIALHQNLR